MADDVDWNALAAQVMANYEATGKWFVSDPGAPASPPSLDPAPAPAVDWNALAAQVLANYEATGKWFVSDTSAPTSPTPPTSPSSPPSNPAGDPNPVTPQTPGYTTVLSDDFSRGYDTSHWGQPFPFPSPPGMAGNGAYFVDPNEVNVRDGEMQVTITHRPDGVWSTSGFNSFKAGVSIEYGKVDFDAKVEAGHGTVFGILMWPSNDTFPPEIDILETPNNKPMFTFHWGDSNGNQSSIIQSSDFDPSQWHHYTMTWLPNDLTIAVDGKVEAEWTANIPNVPMSFGALGVVGGPTDFWIGGPPDSSTPPLVTLHMDNVVMQQWNGIA